MSGITTRAEQKPSLSKAWLVLADFSMSYFISLEVFE